MLSRAAERIIRQNVAVSIAIKGLFVLLAVPFENPGSEGRWIVLELEGTRSNRSAVGARVALTVRTEGGGTRTLHRMVGSGASFGTLPFRQEIGVGDARGVEQVEVLWPGGGNQTFKGLSLDQHYRLRQAHDTAEPVSRRRITLSRTVPPHVHH